MKTKRRLHKLFKKITQNWALLLVLLTLLILLLVSMVSYQWISDAKLRLLFKSSPRVEGQEGFTLEEASMVKADQLKAFFLLGQQSNHTLKEYLAPNKFASTVLQSFELPLIPPNDCEDVYCFQRRLDFSRVPSLLWQILIGIEDRRYLNHSGVDLRSIIRALLADIKSMSFVQGGSTITQQLVKNLFLTNEKSLERKLKEVVFSVYIEFLYEKDEILLAYLNEVYWGVVEGVKLKGVAAASQFYFHKLVSDLNEYEATLLISLLKGPGFYSPMKNIEELKTRVNVLFDKLIQEGHLSKKSIETKWKRDDWIDFEEDFKKREENRMLFPVHFISKIKSSEAQWKNFVLWHAWKEFLNKNPDLKNKTSFKYYEKKIFCPSCIEIGLYSKIERSLEAALREEKHQVGSALKPVIYHTLFSLGLDEQQLLSTEAKTYSLLSGPWSPEEVTAKDLAPFISVKEALQRSLNRPLLQAVELIGWDLVEEELKKDLPILTPLKEYPSQLLGALEISVTKVWDIYQKLFASSCLTSETIPLAMSILSDPTQTTIKHRVQSLLKNSNFFGKTGTSNQGFDNWFIFSDGQELAIVWIGVDGSRDIEELKLFGSNSSFVVFQDYYLYRGQRLREIGCPAESY